MKESKKVSWYTHIFSQMHRISRCLHHVKHHIESHIVIHVDNGGYPEHGCARKSFCPPDDRRSDPWKVGHSLAKFRNRLSASYTRWETATIGIEIGKGGAESGCDCRKIGRKRKKNTSHTNRDAPKTVGRSLVSIPQPLSEDVNRRWFGIQAGTPLP